MTFKNITLFFIIRKKNTGFAWILISQMYKALAQFTVPEFKNKLQNLHELFHYHISTVHFGAFFLTDGPV